MVYEDVERPVNIPSVLPELRPLLPSMYSPLTVKDTGSEGYLFRLPPRAGRFLLDRINGILGESGADLLQKVLVQTIPAETEREAIVTSRVGQGKYRQALVSLWRVCSVTGLDLLELLRASHIKPWSDCNDRERLDVYNGLLLSPAYDAAFDAGFISFADDGGIMISPVLPPRHLAQLGLAESARISCLQPEHLPYLAYHRNEVFRSGAKIQIA